jgi:hypothetical protein
LTFFFQPANITNQILNFGLPAPIDIQVIGYNADANYQIAKEIERRVTQIPGAVMCMSTSKCTPRGARQR